MVRYDGNRDKLYLKGQEMRFPRKVQISGKTYTVTTDKKRWNSSGQTVSQEIVLGAEGGNKERIFDNFIHEVAELALCERNFRYGDGSSDGSMFVMTHKDFTTFASDVATALFPVTKARK